jgi:hypothetical protein
MLKPIPKSDIIVRPIKVYKEWSLDENDVRPIFALSGSSGNFDDEFDETSNGFSKKSLYASIKAQFYLNPATASILTEVGLRKSYASTDERNLEDELVVFSIPQIYIGEGIKVGSVILLDDDTNITLTDDSYSNLIDSGSNIRGNIFYDRGLVVVTKDITSGSNFNTFRLDYRSTKTIYENEIFISVLEHEFNYSQNPSAVYEDGAYKKTLVFTDPNDITGQNKFTKDVYNTGVKYVRKKTNLPNGSGSLDFRIQSNIDLTQYGSWDDYDEYISSDPTGSYLAPYITTIGLYDEDLNMVAVAKLPQPIKSLPDFPVNFIIRFDT